MNRNKSDAIVLGLVSFPVFVMAISMLGFALGATIGCWQAPLGLIASLGFVYWYADEKKASVIWTAAIIGIGVLLSGACVLYSTADGENYHRPALVLLANGWNPLRATEVADIKDMMGGGFGPWHVAFLPRMGQILGASLYKIVGFIEVADCLNIIMFVASIISVRQLLFNWGLGRYVWLATSLVCVSPVVVRGLYGGMVDSAIYSSFLVAASAANREKMPQLTFAVLVMSALKYTGVVVGAIVFAAYAFRTLPDVAKFRKWIVMGMLTGISILLLNASPYLTSLKNHGGPFYPSHSFVKSERFQEENDPLAAIFTAMNDDARQLGYFGRFAWAYISQDIVKMYYRHKTGKADFNPRFEVSGDVGGFGPVFRLFFVLSLVAVPFIRQRKILFLMGIILLTVLIQPTFYSGYARYVPQFYAFPVIAMLGVWHRFEGGERFMTNCAFGVCGVAYATALLAYQLGYVALQWVVSVQNLQIVEAGQRNETIVCGGYLGSRYALSHDCLMKVVGVNVEKSATDASMPYGVGSYFDFYRCYFKDGMPEVYGTNWSHVGNDEQKRAARDRDMMKFFLNEFLPHEIICLPIRGWQTAKLRFRQIIRVIGRD